MMQAMASVLFPFFPFFACCVCVSVPTHILDTAFVLMLYKRKFDNTFLVNTNAAYADSELMKYTSSVTVHTFNRLNTLPSTRHPPVFLCYTRVRFYAMQVVMHCMQQILAIVCL